jgi:prepilin-type processing-associated H-X9-DG protein/prepilin-type N-terminal cleavage/methylation domain-containing protein
MKRAAISRGFSLLELLIVISVIAVLAVLASAVLQSGQRKAKAAQCMSRLRGLGTAIHLYTQEDGEFPRSLHSAGSAGKVPWSRAILPYLGGPSSPSTQDWAMYFEKYYRCPEDKNRDVNYHSYALNVHFELRPDGDDYQGAPDTWRRPANVENASRTILLAEPKPTYFGDHLMCHLWTSAKGPANGLAGTRHDGRSNYLFVDGHVEALAVTDTFDLVKGTNLWNPSLAGK